MGGVYTRGFAVWGPRSPAVAVMSTAIRDLRDWFGSSEWLRVGLASGGFRCRGGAAPAWGQPIAVREAAPRPCGSARGRWRADPGGDVRGRLRGRHPDRVVRQVTALGCWSPRLSSRRSTLTATSTTTLPPAPPGSPLPRPCTVGAIKSNIHAGTSGWPRAFRRCRSATVRQDRCVRLCHAKFRKRDHDVVFPGCSCVVSCPVRSSAGHQRGQSADKDGDDHEG